MADRPAAVLVEHIRRLAVAQGAERLTDRELLKRFTGERDETAFTTLLHRHGPMVLRVCQRLLPQPADVEDVFQAVFLLLARKATGLRNQDSVGNWLYGVAYRLALKVRRAAARRRAHESRAPSRPSVDPLAEITLREAQTLFDEALQQLPEKYRAPLVLCYLEGSTQEEAARQLSCSRSTLKRHLESGRERLRKRLARRGLTLTGALLAAVLSPDLASSALPRELTRATVQAALACAGKHAAAGIVSARVAELVEGGLRTMATAKKIATVLVLALGLAAGGAGLMLSQSPAATAPDEKRAEQPERAAKRADAPEPAQAKSPRLDQYGDAFPPGAVARLGTVRLKPGQNIDFVAFLPGGKTLVSPGWKSICFWDVATGRETRRIEAARHLGPMAISCDGKTLAATSHPNVYLWDTATGKEVLHFQADTSNSRGWLAFAHDGRTMLSGDGRTLDLWDTATGKKLRTLTIPPSGLLEDRFAFSADDRTVITLQKNEILFTDLSSGKEVRKIQVKGLLTEATFSSDGKLMAARGEKNTIHIFDLVHGKEVRNLTVPQVPCAFSPDNKVLLCGGEAIVLLDLATGREVRRLPVPGIPISVAFSPDGKLLAQGHSWWSGLHLWDLETSKELLRRPGHTGEVASIVFSPDGKTVVSRSGQDKTLCFWQTETGKALRILSTEGDERRADAGYGQAIAYSPDGRFIALGDYGGSVRIWDTGAGKEVRQLEIDRSSRFLGCRFIDSVSFSPDGRALAFCGAKTIHQSPELPGCITVFDLGTGKTTLNQPLSFRPRSSAFSADQRFLALANEKQLWLWDLSRNRSVLILEHQGYVWHAAFSPDGRFIATTSTTPEQGSDWCAHLWEVASGKEVLRLGADGWKVCFSPDGVLASGGDKAIRVWNLATKKEVARFQGQRAPVSCLAFSPDGKRLATGFTDSTTLVWDAANAAGQTGISPKLLRPEELRPLWEKLAGTDATQAYTAIWALVAARERSVTFLKGRLHAAGNEKLKRLPELLADLDSREFGTREAASKELEKLLPDAESALRKTLAGNASPEQRRRIEALLALPAGIIRDPETLHGVRAIQILEHVGSPEAEKLLKSLSEGMPEARLTQEAKASLERLAKRPAAKP